jgi:hypothetical protein
MITIVPATGHLEKQVDLGRGTEDKPIGQH